MSAYAAAMVRRAPTIRLSPDRRGVSAVEFALVAAPFVVALLAICGAGLSFYQQQALDYAVQAAARQAQIGNVPPGTTEAQFVQNTLCPVLGQFQSCANLFVDLRPVTDYAQLTISGTPDAPDGTSTTGFVFCPGQPGQLMYAHVVYLAPSIGGLLIGSVSGGLAPIIANAGFANENPSGASVPPGTGC